MCTYPTSSSLQSRSTIPLTAILFEFLYPWILFPHTGNIPDKMICPNLACFVFFSSFLYFSTIAVVPSLSVLFVPTCTSMAPPFPLPTIFSTLSLAHVLFLLPVNTLLRPPLAQSWICFPDDRVSYVNRSVSLDAIYHCRWIALPSFSLLSNPSPNLVVLCTVLLSLLGSVAFLFLCCRVLDDHQERRWCVSYLSVSVFY